MWEFGVSEPKLSKTDMKRLKKRGYVAGKQRKLTKAELRKKRSSSRKTKKMTKRVWRKLV